MYASLTWVIISLDIGRLSIRRQAIIWTNDDFQSVRLHWTDFNAKIGKLASFYLAKLYFKLSSVILTTFVKVELWMS